MDANNYFEFAMKYLDLGAKLLQFLIIVSAAIGGWLIASDEIGQSAIFSLQRTFWALLYTLIALIVWRALMSTLRKANACLALARKAAPTEVESEPAFEEAFRDWGGKGMKFGLPILIIMVDIAILTVTDTPFNWF